LPGADLSSLIFKKWPEKRCTGIGEAFLLTYFQLLARLLPYFLALNSSEILDGWSGCGRNKGPKMSRNANLWKIELHFSERFMAELYCPEKIGRN